MLALFVRSINARRFTRKPDIPIIKLLVFIFRDGNGAHFTQTGEGLLKQPFIVISVMCGICSGPILNQGKQCRNQGNIKESDFPDVADTLHYVPINIKMLDKRLRFVS